ncbi:MAG TPA: glycosyltransferase family 9 protein [Flavobacteriales bacterium]
MKSLEHVTRILVIRFSSIGDIVLTTPVVRALNQQLDGKVEVHFLTKKKFASLLEANPYIHRIHIMEKTVQEVLPELEKLDFHYIIDLHRNIRTRIVKRRLKVLDFTFSKLNFKKWLWVNFGINRMPNRHIVDRYMDTLRAFGVKDDGKGLDYFIPENAGLQPNDLPATHQGKYVAFAIGAMHIGKRLSAEHIAEICKACSLPVVLLGGKEDVDAANYVAQQCGDKVFSAAGKFTLHQSADCLRKAEVVVSGDTGLMHIASAFQCKILSLWGCTVPGFGMYPYRPHPASVIMEPKGRKRRPCSKLGNRCKYGKEHRCIEQIDVHEISETLERLIKT